MSKKYTFLGKLVLFEKKIIFLISLHFKVIEDGALMTRKLTQKFSLKANLSIFASLSPLSLSKFDELISYISSMSVHHSEIGEFISIITKKTKCFIDTNTYSFCAVATDLPNVIGKALCGPNFSIRIGDFGYGIKPATEIAKKENITSKVQRVFLHHRTSTENFCKNIYLQMRTIGGSIIGNLLTPLVFGKILYTPHSALTGNIISKVRTSCFFLMEHYVVVLQFS